MRFLRPLVLLATSVLHFIYGPNLLAEAAHYMRRPPHGSLLTALTAPENPPAFVHCAGGNRAAVLLKRMAVNKLYLPGGDGGIVPQEHPRAETSTIR